MVGELSPVDLALEQLSLGVDHLVKLLEDGGLDHYDNAGFVTFTQDFEKIRNRIPLADHRIDRRRGAAEPARGAHPAEHGPHPDVDVAAVAGGGVPAGPGRRRGRGPDSACSANR